MFGATIRAYQAETGITVIGLRGIIAYMPSAYMMSDVRGMIEACGHSIRLERFPCLLATPVHKRNRNRSEGGTVTHWYSTATQLADGTCLVGFPVQACSTTQAKSRARKTIEAEGFPVLSVYYAERRGPRYTVSLDLMSERFRTLSRHIPNSIRTVSYDGEG